MNAGALALRIEGELEEDRTDGERIPGTTAVRRCLRIVQRIAPELWDDTKVAAFTEEASNTQGHVVSLVIHSHRTDRQLLFTIIPEHKSADVGTTYIDEHQKHHTASIALDEAMVTHGTRVEPGDLAELKRLANWLERGVVPGCCVPIARKP